MSLGVVPDIVTVHSVSILVYQHIPTNTCVKKVPIVSNSAGLSYSAALRP